MPTPLAKFAEIELSGLRGSPLRLRPALIASLVAGPPTKVSLLDGSVTLVRESPEEICGLVAALGRKALPGAANYAKLKGAIARKELPEFISGDDGKALWIEALRAVSYEAPRGKFRRLLGIYSQILSPFSLIKSFTLGAKPGLSPLEAEMLAKGYAVVGRRRGGGF